MKLITDGSFFFPKKPLFSKILVPIPESPPGLVLVLERDLVLNLVPVWFY